MNFLIDYLMMLLLFLSIFSVYSAERNETSTNDQDLHQLQLHQQQQQHHQLQHHHHHHQHPELLTPIAIVDATTITNIIATTSTTNAILANTSSSSSLTTKTTSSSSSSHNVTAPLVTVAAPEVLQSNANKRLIMPKRRSYRNHNMRTSSVVTQVTRSVRKRR